MPAASVCTSHRASRICLGSRPPVARADRSAPPPPPCGQPPMPRTTRKMPAVTAKTASAADARSSCRTRADRTNAWARSEPVPADRSAITVRITSVTAEPAKRNAESKTISLSVICVPEGPAAHRGTACTRPVQLCAWLWAVHWHSCDYGGEPAIGAPLVSASTRLPPRAYTS